MDAYVIYLFRYREVAQQSNARYLNALAQVDDPTPGLRGLDTITTRKHPTAGRPVKAFNPVARSDSHLFVALMSGEHAVHGFANRDLRAKLTGHLREDPKQQSAQISRLLHRLHVYGLVAKIPRSRRWRVTAFGHRVMGASVRLRQLHFPRALCRGRVRSAENFIAKSKEPTTEESTLPVGLLSEFAPSPFPARLNPSILRISFRWPGYCCKYRKTKALP
jgi:hypothetical protein